MVWSIISPPVVTTGSGPPVFNRSDQFEGILDKMDGHGSLANLNAFINALEISRPGLDVQEGAEAAINLLANMADRLHFPATAQLRTCVHFLVLPVEHTSCI